MTDDRMQKSRIEKESVGIPEGFRLNYQRLPRYYCCWWLQKLEGSYHHLPIYYPSAVCLNYCPVKTNDVTKCIGQNIKRLGCSQRWCWC